jgi:hypothetical protein
MVIIFLLSLAMITMLGFWGLAWWVLKQPVPRGSIEPRPPQSQWRNEPTHGQGPPPGSTRRPSEVPPDVPVPSPRTHDNSDSNTQFFSRIDTPQRAKLAEETEILSNQPPATERTI